MRALPSLEESLRIHSGDAVLDAKLFLPAITNGMVIFAHAAGGSGFPVRDIAVMRALQEAGMATLLLDLLTEQEGETYWSRFAQKELTNRLLDATRRVLADARVAHLPLGYFCVGGAGASALRIATVLHDRVHAIVCRGARFDPSYLSVDNVTAAVLCIAPQHDPVLLDASRHLYDRLLGARARKLLVVDGATRLFDEAGALDRVASAATGWFTEHLR